MDKVIENGKLEWRPKTLQTYSTVVKLFQKHLNGQRVSSKEIISFLLNQKEKGKSTRTLAKYRNTLNRLFNRAIEMGLMDENPVGTIKKVSFSPQSLLYFSDKQIERFRRMEKPEQIWMAIQFLYYCFIRPGEQREMKINWISFDFGFIEIPAAYSKNKKTQKISIPNVFLKQIDFLKQYPGSFYVLSKNGKPGQEQIAINHLNYEHRKLLDKLQIRGRYAFYSWKHTGVVKAVKAGINVKDIQLQLRHHSLDMVNEYLKDLGVMDSEDLKQRFPEL